MTFDDLEEVLRPLAKLIRERVQEKRMHILILGFTLDEDNCPEHMSAYGTFGEDRGGLMGCAHMIASLADPQIGEYQPPRSEH